jgi:hypothetical protein
VATAAALPSDPASSSSPSPPDPALVAAATALQGTWLADYGASTNRDALLTALGLSGLQRVTAQKLIEGVEVEVVNQGGGGGGVPAFEVRFLTVVPFFKVSETVPLDGSPSTQARRDLKAGKQTARAAVGREPPAADGRPPPLTITLSWQSPAPACLVETYSLAPESQDALTVTAAVWTGAVAASAGARGRTPAGPPRAAATTLYRCAAGGRWTPRYSYPGGGDGDATRRALLLVGLGLAALPPQPAAAFPALPGSAPTRPPSRVFAPAPLPLFPRRSLDRPFAVLLMRSCYDALADAVPGYPMSAFQAAFWTRRADEWEAYIRARADAGAAEPRPPQGDLTAASYFDFISHAQWGALDVAVEGAADLLAAPLLAAEGWADEGEGGGGGGGGRETEVTVDLAAAAAAAASSSSSSTSAPALPPPPALRAALATAAGDRIYAALAEGFQGQAFNPPRPPSPADRVGALRAAVEALLAVFVRCGFALSATVALDPDSAPSDAAGTLVVSVLGPATLWGAAERAARGASPNALDALAVGGLLRAGGVGATLVGVEVGETGYTHRWVVGEGPVRVDPGVAPPSGGGEEEEVVEG